MPTTVIVCAETPCLKLSVGRNPLDDDNHLAFAPTFTGLGQSCVNTQPDEGTLGVVSGSELILLDARPVVNAP